MIMRFCIFICWMSDLILTNDSSFLLCAVSVRRNQRRFIDGWRFSAGPCKLLLWLDTPFSNPFPPGHCRVFFSPHLLVIIAPQFLIVLQIFFELKWYNIFTIVNNHGLFSIKRTFRSTFSIFHTVALAFFPTGSNNNAENHCTSCKLYNRMYVRFLSTLYMLHPGSIRALSTICSIDSHEVREKRD